MSDRPYQGKPVLLTGKAARDVMAQPPARHPLARTPEIEEPFIAVSDIELPSIEDGETAPAGTGDDQPEYHDMVDAGEIDAPDPIAGGLTEEDPADAISAIEANSDPGPEATPDATEAVPEAAPEPEATPEATEAPEAIQPAAEADPEPEPEATPEPEPVVVAPIKRRTRRTTTPS